MNWNRAFPLLLAASIVAELPAQADNPQVRVKGSDTIGGALGPELAEQYHSQNPAASIVWEALGSATGFAGLFDGSADLAASSRPINDAEMSEAKRQNAPLKEWVIAYDGVALIVNPSNPLPKLTIAQASSLFQGTIKNWKQLGGPDRPVHLVGRPSYSGTHSFFKEKILRRGNGKGPEDFSTALEVLESNPEILARVANDPAAVSYIGQGWLGPAVRAVPLASTSTQPALLPNRDTVRTGSYPAFRALYLYTRGEPTGDARNLLAFILSREGQEIVAKNGFVPTDLPSLLAYSPTRREVPTGVAHLPELGAPSSPSARPANVEAVEAAPAPSMIIRIYFPSGGSRLSDEAELKIMHAADLVKSGRHAFVVGHADSNGSAMVNRTLSQARAAAVLLALHRAGAPFESLASDAKAADEPVATNSTALGRRENRRVDVIVLEVPRAQSPAHAG